MLHAFATYPDQWQRFRRNPGLAQVAFDEAVRLESPVQTLVAITGAGTAGLLLSQPHWVPPSEAASTAPAGNHAGLPMDSRLGSRPTVHGKWMRDRTLTHAARRGVCGSRTTNDWSTSMQQVRAVVAREKDAPVTVETINVPDPGPGEAVVKIQACGVCHTDLHYRQGAITDEFPFLLGHEAAGVVESVGEGADGVAPGDFVILNWRAVCGQCRACARGEPWYCFNTHNAAQKMTLADGTELTPALGIGAFAEKTLVHSGQCTKVDPAASPAAAGLLGCGVMAGMGAAINTGNVGRGKSVAVIGCGGVGSAAIAGSKLAGASRIIAVDIDDRKLQWAKNLGATDTVNSREKDPVQAIQELTGGFGADVVIDAVGHPETYRQAFYARDLAGTVVLVGVPTPDMKVPDLPLIDVFGRGGALKSSWYGDCLPSRDFPMLIDLYQKGQLDLDAFVSEEIGLNDVEAAFDRMHRGDVLRSVVIL
jgi:S-(hydroxymethyl)mycothiol dehydrogenase